jgi:hypothetical protein
MKYLLFIIFLSLSTNVLSEDASEKATAESLYVLAYLSFLNERKCLTLESEDIISYATVFSAFTKSIELSLKSEEKAKKKIELLEASASQSFSGTAFYPCNEQSEVISSTTISSLEYKLREIYGKQ